MIDEKYIQEIIDEISAIEKVTEITKETCKIFMRDSYIDCQNKKIWVDPTFITQYYFKGESPRLCEPHPFVCICFYSKDGRILQLFFRDYTIMSRTSVKEKPELLNYEDFLYEMREIYA